MGFWSKDAEDQMEPLDRNDAERTGFREQRIAFRGISPDGEFVWVQSLDCWTFCVKVRYVNFRFLSYPLLWGTQVRF